MVMGQLVTLSRCLLPVLDEADSPGMQKAQAHNNVFVVHYLKAGHSIQSNFTHASSICVRVIYFKCDLDIETVTSGLGRHARVVEPNYLVNHLDIADTPKMMQRNLAVAIFLF